jgi:hypothetical protein
MADSPIEITYPANGSTIKGNRFAASGTSPLNPQAASGALARQDGTGTAVKHKPLAALTQPTRWVIDFETADVGGLFKTGEKVLLVTLTVTDQNGDTRQATFTIDKRANAAQKKVKHKVTFGGAITPDPALAGTEVTCPFTSSGEENPADPLYAFLALPGGQPVFGSLVQTAQGNGEFVFSWQNVPAGMGYTIYYQSYGGQPMAATDGPFNVD